MPNQRDRAAADDARYFQAPGGFDAPLGPEPECFSARRIVTMIEQGVQAADRAHMSECDPCMTALAGYLVPARKFALYLPQLAFAAHASRVSVEMFGSPELVSAIDPGTLRIDEGGLRAAVARVVDQKSNLLAVTFEQTLFSDEVQRELSSYPELVKRVTLTGMLRGGGPLIESRGEIVLRNQAAEAR